MIAERCTLETESFFLARVTLTSSKDLTSWLMFLSSYSVSFLSLTSIHTWAILTRDLVHYPFIPLGGPLVLRMYQHPLEGQMRLHGHRYTMTVEHPAQGFQNSFGAGNGQCGIGVPVPIASSSSS